MTQHHSSLSSEQNCVFETISQVLGECNSLTHVTLPVLGMSKELPNCVVMVSSCLCHLIAICLAFWLAFFSFKIILFFWTRWPLLSPALGCNDQGTLRFHALWNSLKRFHGKSKNDFSLQPGSIELVLDDKQRWHTGGESPVQSGLAFPGILDFWVGLQTDVPWQPHHVHQTLWEWWQERIQWSGVTCTYFLGKEILLARLMSCFIGGQGGSLGRGNWGLAAQPL